MPPIVLTIVSLISLVNAAAPEAVKLYERAKELFNMMFAGGLITLGQQQALMEWADAHMAATLAGEVPPELQIEPDPVED